MYKLLYTESALSDLKKLDYSVAQRIVEKIAFFVNQKNPLSFAKSLRGVAKGRYRFRIGNYRAIFRIDKHGTIHILIILRIKHRKDIYDL